MPSFCIILDLIARGCVFSVGLGTGRKDCKEKEVLSVFIFYNHKG